MARIVENKSAACNVEHDERMDFSDVKDEMKKSLTTFRWFSIPLRGVIVTSPVSVGGSHEQ